MAKVIDCSDAIALLEAHRVGAKHISTDITPRLISWGLLAIRRESKGSGGAGKGGNLAALHNAQRNLYVLSVEHQWKQVRQNLSAGALIALASLVKKEMAGGAKGMD